MASGYTLFGFRRGPRRLAPAFRRKIEKRGIATPRRRHRLISSADLAAGRNAPQRERRKAEKKKRDELTGVGLPEQEEKGSRKNRSGSKKSSGVESSGEELFLPTLGLPTRARTLEGRDLRSSIYRSLENVASRKARSRKKLARFLGQETSCFHLMRKRRQTRFLSVERPNGLYFHRPSGPTKREIHRETRSQENTAKFPSWLTPAALTRHVS